MKLDCTGWVYSVNCSVCCSQCGSFKVKQRHIVPLDKIQVIEATEEKGEEVEENGCLSEERNKIEELKN